MYSTVHAYCTFSDFYKTLKGLWVYSFSIVSFAATWTGVTQCSPAHAGSMAWLRPEQLRRRLPVSQWWSIWSSTQKVIGLTLSGILWLFLPSRLCHWLKKNIFRHLSRLESSWDVVHCPCKCPLSFLTYLSTYLLMYIKLRLCFYYRFMLIFCVLDLPFYNIHQG